MIVEEPEKECGICGKAFTDRYFTGETKITKIPQAAMCYSCATGFGIKPKKIAKVDGSWYTVDIVDISDIEMKKVSYAEAKLTTHLFKFYGQRKPFLVEPGSKKKYKLRSSPYLVAGFALRQQTQCEVVVLDKKGEASGDSAVEVSASCV